MSLTGLAGANTTYYVDPNGSKDFTAIQAAIDAAYDYDQIEVAPGTYYETIDFLGKAIRLYSRDGQDVTTIDANGAYHVVQCVNGEGANTVLEDFTITGGDASGTGRPDAYGGGMYCGSSSPTVTGCKFTDNSAQYGGGMHNYYSHPIVTNCTFSGNTASTSRGGGMYNFYSNPNVTNCSFSNNEATSMDGGGIYNEESDPMLPTVFSIKTSLVTKEGACTTTTPAARAWPTVPSPRTRPSTAAACETTTTAVPPLPIAHSPIIGPGPVMEAGYPTPAAALS
jgi:parallel beta-helix repeat protein